MNDPQMTPEQFELARHALGLPNRTRKSYRNHFVCGPGHSDFDNWVAMTADGLARRHAGNELTGGDDCFCLTKAGATQALKPHEKLDAEDFPEHQGQAS